MKLMYIVSKWRQFLPQYHQCVTEVSTIQKLEELLLTNPEEHLSSISIFSQHQTFSILIIVMVTMHVWSVLIRAK
jgi:hypothetical protein